MKNKSKKQTKDDQTLVAMGKANRSSQDPLGSYTGKPSDHEKPVQDADDL